MHDNTLEGIIIVEGIVYTAYLVNRSFTKEQLTEFLKIFGHKTAEGNPYTDPVNLVSQTYKNCSFSTAIHFKDVFPWFTPNIDRTVLE
jgi:hypothetical protein